MPQTIYSRFLEIAKAQANEPAIIEDERTLTFAELANLSDAIGRLIPNDAKSVGIVMEHRAEMIAAILSVLKAGARYVPAEPSFPTKRILGMMKEAKVDYILTEEQYISRFDGINSGCINYNLFCGSSNFDFNYSGNENDAAYVLYTSGTTGRPKGICVANSNVLHYARAFANEFHPDKSDIMLQYSVCTFDIFVEEMFCSLLNGAALAIPNTETKSDLTRLIDFINRKNITIISGFPYLLADLNRMPNIPDSVRLLISGGDVLRAVYVDKLIKKTIVYNTYGPSETTVCAAYYKCNNGTIMEDGTYPIGKAVLGSFIRVVKKNGEDAEPYEPGEIYIYGNGVSNGYIGDHDKENRAFVRLVNGGVYYKSGDYGYALPDGNIVFMHRLDKQIMVYGKRVELSEVESTLYKCDGVRQAVVTSYNDKDGLPYIVAFLVPDKAEVTASVLREEMAETLASYMIPEFFVKMPSIKLTVNGKPDLKALPIVMKN